MSSSSSFWASRTASSVPITVMSSWSLSSAVGKMILAPVLSRTLRMFPPPFPMRNLWYSGLARSSAVWLFVCLRKTCAMLFLRQQVYCKSTSIIKNVITKDALINFKVITDGKTPSCLKWFNLRYKNCSSQKKFSASVADTSYAQARCFYSDSWKDIERSSQHVVMYDQWGTEEALDLFTPPSMPLANGCQFSKVKRSSAFYHWDIQNKPFPLPRQAVAAWLSPPPL